MQTRPRELARLFAGLGLIGVVTLIYVRVLHVENAAIVSTTFLLVVLVMAATSRRWVAVTTSLGAVLCFNFFFLPPVHTFTIADPQNLLALIAFLAVSLVGSNLSAGVRARTEEAVARRNELTRLFDLSRDVLMTTDSGDAIGTLARAMARRFDLAFVAVALPRGGEWELFSAGATTLQLDRPQLSSAYASAQTTLEFDATTRSYSGHQTMTVGDQPVRLVPLRVGTRAIGMLAAAGRPVEAGTLDALAGIAAIAIERAQFLEERKSAELTRQSEQLKTTLLASIGHDLRTPLTAIRLAATNIKSPSLSAAERDEQSDLILAETERLNRLFQNILEMARLDANAVTADARWTHPSEIVEGARDQVAATLAGRRLQVDVEHDRAVRIDPRLIASALARLIENAAQYAPAGSTIDLSASATDQGLTLSVRDHGGGIAPNDLPHLFERFYRGAAASGRASSSGMGLWIARELLAVQGGRVWADNCADGGARFTITVPAATREAAEPSLSDAP